MSEFKLQLGINNCSNKQYHADRDYLSSSVLKTLAKSPTQYYNEYILGQNKEEHAQDRYVEGSAVHTLLLEPALFDSEYAIYPGQRKAGAAWESFKADNSDKPILSSTQLFKVQAYAKAFNDNPICKSHLEDCLFEHTLCVNLFGINIKVRADAINVEKGYVFDVKTTSGPVGHEDFKLTVKQWSYELSGALYALAFEEYYKKPFQFLFGAISKRSPIEAAVFRLSDKSRAEGIKVILQAVKNYKRGIETGDWSDDVVSESHTNSVSSEILEV